MNLLQLDQFRVLARVQHMTRAAEELYIAQPSLSKAIKHLEEEIGVPLFDRLGRRICLNRFGAAYLESVEQAFLALEEGKRQVRDMAHLDRGEVVLAAPALHWLPNPLHAFRAAHPATHFRLLQGTPPEMQRHLETGNIDFAFTPAAPETPDIQWRPLLANEIFLIVARGHRLDGRQCVPLHEVALEDMVLCQDGSILRDLMEAACRQAGFTLQAACEANDPAAMRDFVRAGLGAAFLPDLVRWQQGDQGLSWIRITDPDCCLPIGLAWHKEHHLSGAACAFQDFIIEYFSASSRGCPS